jgi:hypothetical protein
MMAYLLMDSEGEEGQKQFILRNHYTRGQVSLFIAAEQQYGFEQILDWMRYGETSRLEDGHLEDVRNVNVPAGAQASTAAYYASAPAKPVKPVSSLELQGILWGSPPTAIINNHSVFPNDEFQVKIGGKEETIRCLEIQTNFVRVQNEDSGEQEQLQLWNH